MENLSNFTKKISAWIKVEVSDKNGNVIQKIEQPAHTWVKGFQRLLEAVLLSDTYSFAFRKTTDGSTVWIQNTYDVIMHTQAPAGNDNYGILVGTSDTAYSFDQYNLVSKISHGNTSGTLSYETSSYEVADTSISITRTFLNLGTTDVVVREIGLFSIVQYRPDSSQPWTTEYSMWARDVITPVTVPQDGRLRVTYIIRVM